MRKFMLTMQLGGYVLGWYSRAAIDGKVTGHEMVDLVKGGLEIYEDATGKKVDVDISDLQ